MSPKPKISDGTIFVDEDPYSKQAQVYSEERYYEHPPPDNSTVKKKLSMMLDQLGILNKNNEHLNPLSPLQGIKRGRLTELFPPSLFRSFDLKRNPEPPTESKVTKAP